LAPVSSHREFVRRIAIRQSTVASLLRRRVIAETVVMPDRYAGLARAIPGRSIGAIHGASRSGVPIRHHDCRPSASFRHACGGVCERCDATCVTRVGAARFGEGVETRPRRRWMVSAPDREAPWMAPIERPGMAGKEEGQSTFCIMRSALQRRRAKGTLTLFFARACPARTTSISTVATTSPY
jgi:hypothetical protein